MWRGGIPTTTIKTFRPLQTETVRRRSRKRAVRQSVRNSISHRTRAFLFTIVPWTCSHSRTHASSTRLNKYEILSEKKPTNSFFFNKIYI